jgi:hypothetical protein
MRKGTGAIPQRCGIPPAWRGAGADATLAGSSMRFPPAAKSQSAGTPTLRRAALLLTLATSCTTMRDEGRRTLDWLDRTCTPEGTAARWALSPVATGLGLMGLAADTLVVNPCCAVDDAWHDTVQALWTNEDESRFRRAMLTPLAALATPVWFGVDWAFRCVVPMPPAARARQEDDAAIQPQADGPAPEARR